MPEHPQPADLDRLVQGTLTPRERQLLVSHLLERCPRCCGALALRCGFEMPGDAGEDYGVAIDRALTAAVRTTEPRREAIATLASLLANRSDRAGGSAPKLPVTGLRGLPRLRALLEASRALRHEDPQAMLRFARLARCAADQLRMREFGSAPVADLRALAWAELGSAYRVCNELVDADRAMNRATYWCRRGSQSPALLARVADLVASLLAYQRRFPEARQLLAVVYKIHTQAGDRHLAGRVMISLGNIAAWDESPSEAVMLLGRGLDLLEPHRDPQLEVQTVWNMLSALVRLGHFRNARRLLWRSRILLIHTIDSHRIRWLEGRILAGLADFPRAEAAFRQARAGFAEQGQVYPAAIVGLDLAALWARQGRFGEVFDIAEEMIVTFRALRIAREAVASLIVLKRACYNSGSRILQVIDIAADLLQHLERQPARPRAYSGSPPAPGPGSPSAS